jgi:hypothetical protein
MRHTALWDSSRLLTQEDLRHRVARHTSQGPRDGLCEEQLSPRLGEMGGPHATFLLRQLRAVQQAVIRGGKQADDEFSLLERHAARLF